MTILINPARFLASLTALTLDTPTVVEHTAAGVLVGTLAGMTAGSTLSITDTAGSRFALDGNTVETGTTATDYATATSHNITVRETLAASSNSPRDSVIAISVTDAPFSPLDLAPFAWYDPSDLSSMFTDDGITNVTTDGDIVYRINDKSGGGRHLKQATLANRPIYKTSGGLRWLQFDGVNDTILGTVNLGATDKVTVFVGVNSPADDAGNIVNHNGGGIPYFTIGRRTAVAGYTYIYRGPTTTVSTQATTYAAPESAVLTMLIDKSVPVIIGRRNGVQVVINSTDTGAGNFVSGSFALSTTLQTNIYGCILMTSVATAGNIANAEAWMATKLGTTIP